MIKRKSVLILVAKKDKENAATSCGYGIYGVPGQIWTAGPTLRRRVLYPAELYGRVWYMIIARSKSNCNPLFSFFWGGRCNATLGGPRYIHLTKETNAVFSGFSALLAPAAISMNSITLVMNFHCILFWHSGQSLLESNSDLSLSNFHKSQPWLNLRRTPLYPFN